MQSNYVVVSHVQILSVAVTITVRNEDTLVFAIVDFFSCFGVDSYLVALKYVDHEIPY